jgi:hypothetical protein
MSLCMSLYIVYTVSVASQARFWATIPSDFSTFLGQVRSGGWSANRRLTPLPKVGELANPRQNLYLNSSCLNFPQTC